MQIRFCVDTYVRSCPIENSHLPDAVLEQSNGTFLLQRRQFPCMHLMLLGRLNFRLKDNDILKIQSLEDTE